MVKNPPTNAGDVGSIPGLGRSPGGGNGNPLQWILENALDSGAWWATVHGVAKLDMIEHTHTHASSLTILNKSWGIFQSSSFQFSHSVVSVSL